MGASFVIGAMSLFTDGAIDAALATSSTRKAKLKEEREILAQAASGEITEEKARLQIVVARHADTGARSTVLLLIFWVLFGAIVAIRSQGGDTLFGFEFAVSALSTGGLQGFATKPSSCSPHPQLPDDEAAFLGLYLLTGIPLFGLCCGKVANVLIVDYLAAKVLAEHESEAVMCEDAPIYSNELDTLEEVQAYAQVKEKPITVLPVPGGHTHRISEEAQTINLTFFEYVCHQAISDGVFDTDFIELQKRKFNSLH